MIQGKAREQQQFDNSKKIGLFEAKVIAINPTREEYKELLGIDLQEDSKATDYLGEKEGNTTLRLNFWVEDIKTGFKSPITFFLENKIRENKDGSKKQYINNVGTCSWAEDKNSLPEWFKGREYREAFIGEEDMYAFLRTWLGNLDYKDADTVLQLDWKKLMKGNVSDLKGQIDGAYCTNIVAMATVKNVIKEDETKEYQSIYNGGVLPAYSLKQFRLVDYGSDSVINSIKNKKPKDQKPHEKFVLKVVGEYGCKDVYILRDLKDYNPEEHFVASDKAISEDGDDY